LFTASIAVPEAFRYIFWGDRHAATGERCTEAVMDWARILAYVTGTVTSSRLASMPAERYAGGDAHPGALGVSYNPGFAAEADEVIYAQKHP
jgi:hypothetical protein